METKQIYKKMADILQDVEAITKDQNNKEQGYKFRGIDDVYNALHPLFKKHRVFITSEVLDERREEKEGKTGNKRFYALLSVKFTYYAEDGSFVCSTMKGEAMDSGDKATNKAMSAAQKYSLIQMFLIPTVEGSPDSDKGGDSADLSELEGLKLEILKFTEVDLLVYWAGQQDGWTANKEFRDAVMAQKTKLTPKPKNTKK